MKDELNLRVFTMNRSSALTFLQWAIEYAQKGTYNFKNHNQIVKSEKYETFCASKLLIWCQRWTAGVRHGTSFVVCRVSSGRPIVVLF